MKIILLKEVQSPYIDRVKILPIGRQMEVEKELGEKWVDEGIARVDTRIESPMEYVEKRKATIKKAKERFEND